MKTSTERKESDMILKKHTLIEIKPTILEKKMFKTEKKKLSHWSKCPCYQNTTMNCILKKSSGNKKKESWTRCTVNMLFFCFFLDQQ